ncbi:NYN domain-containing protein [Massilia sp. W12]|uniref:LabA-like NYN domain-containing protein n=1 Tax=Massilia sp. W12 TaxID=3126507 RepID=UPI0030D4B15F
MKVGIYVDVSNIVMNGGFGMRYDILQAFACRDGSDAMRLNTYVSFDQERANSDPLYGEKQARFHAVLRDLGYKVIIKETKWYTDDTGARIGKSNVDLDLAVDVLLQSCALDRVLLVTGDGDFVQVVRALQNKGCRVECIAFDNVSHDLRKEVDLFTPGYLIPGLLPIIIDEQKMRWEVGSWVRGVMISFDPNKHYGFFRFINNINGKLWLTDSRDPDSAYLTAYFNEKDLPLNCDAQTHFNRGSIFEFRVESSGEGKYHATNIRLIRSNRL